MKATGSGATFPSEVVGWLRKPVNADAVNKLRWLGDAESFIVLSGCRSDCIGVLKVQWLGMGRVARRLHILKAMFADV